MLTPFPSEIESLLICMCALEALDRPRHVPIRHRERTTRTRRLLLPRSPPHLPRSLRPRRALPPRLPTLLLRLRPKRPPFLFFFFFFFFRPPASHPLREELDHAAGRRSLPRHQRRRRPRHV